METTMNSKKSIKTALIFACAIMLHGCAAGPANYDDKPNAIQRAEVVSKNSKGITVEHSTWGKKIAFRFADEHCATMGKVATYLGASTQYGPDVISTWRCE
jgi:starvation-inducible outer membrane lipoprotein